MKEIIIYEFQLKEIHDALRMVANRLDSRDGKTAMDRTIRNAEQYAKNALEGNKDLRVQHGKTLQP